MAATSQINLDNNALAAWWAQRQSEVESTLSAANVTAAWWSFGLNDGIAQNAADLEQCLTIIATVPQGSDPHRPDFASRVYDYIDRPLPQATPFVVRELVGAIAKWEPRLKLDSLKVNPYEGGEAALTVRANWSIGAVAGELDIAIAGPRNA